MSSRREAENIRVKHVLNQINQIPTNFSPMGDFQPTKEKPKAFCFIFRKNISPMDVPDVWDPLSDPADEPPVVVASQFRDVATTAEAQGGSESSQNGK